MRSNMRVAECRCGQLRAVCHGKPQRVSVCHCLECQRRTGSAFAVQARYSKTDVAVEGSSRLYERTGDSGMWARYHFCPDCGSTVFYENEDTPGVYAIPVGAFADSTFPAPQRSIFESRMHPWTGVAGDAVDHER
ncbi:GFA family protein [Rhizobium sp.]|uniref:GFA family protein n=1 Tax=Rhizobium sp. TaxID=391 RepID=UPI0028A9C48B